MKVKSIKCHWNKDEDKWYRKVEKSCHVCELNKDCPRTIIDNNCTYFKPKVKKYKYICKGCTEHCKIPTSLHFNPTKCVVTGLSVEWKLKKEKHNDKQ